MSSQLCYQRSRNRAAAIPEFYLQVSHLVPGIASRLMKSLSLPYCVREDLEQSGHVALLEASRQARLANHKEMCAYAAIRIRGSMIDFLRKNTVVKSSQGATHVMSFSEDQLPATCAHAALPGVANPEEAFISMEQRRIILQHVAELPCRERTIVKQHYYEGKKFKEISVGNVGLSCVSKLHKKALRRVGKRLLR